MSRTTPGLVKEILGNNYDQGSAVRSAPSLAPYIRTANILVNQLVARAAAAGRTAIDTPTLNEIELWLAAHAYTQMDPLYKSRSTGGASGSFADQSYKDMAISLDPTGLLVDILNPKKVAVGAMWLGKTEPDQRSYNDRN